MYEGLDLKGINPLWEDLASEEEVAKGRHSEVQVLKTCENYVTSRRDPDYASTARKMNTNYFYRNFLKEHNLRVSNSLEKLDKSYNEQISY